MFPFFTRARALDLRRSTKTESIGGEPRLHALLRAINITLPACSVVDFNSAAAAVPANSKTFTTSVKIPVTFCIFEPHYLPRR